MNIRLIILLVTVLNCINCLAQESYSVLTIPKELKENANAVVREANVEVFVNSISDLRVVETRVVTILNSRGDKYINAFAHYSDSKSIKKLSAIVYDSFGEEIEKFSKSDFEDVSYVSDGTMYSDDRLKYLNYVPKSYPYTLKFYSEYKTGTTAFIPSWRPLEGYNVSVEKSSYTFKTEGLKFRNKIYNQNELVKLVVEEDDNSLHCKVANVSAIKYEDYAPSFSSYMPKVKIALDKFELYGLKGEATDWKTFGKWQYENLLEGRDILNEDVLSKIKTLTNGVEDPLDKAKIIYKYVQDNTRYISVQLGIGGLQPEYAKNVDKVKYGDCKGLTNYTKALLKSQGIESYYAEVFSGGIKEDIDAEFTSFQGDHVILCIPNGEEYTWLECTSQQAPFGYLGKFTDDRDVLVMKPEGGEILHTTKYDGLDNEQTIKARIELFKDGGFSSNVELLSKGIRYGNKQGLEKLAKDKQKQYYLDRWNYINNLIINESSSKNKKEVIEFKEVVSLSTATYGTKAGTKILVPINPFNRITKSPLRFEERKLPFQINRSFTDIDDYEFLIPEGYKIESVPDNYSKENEFGKYEVSINRIGENKIKYSRKLLLKEGIYSKEKYKDYRDFIKKIVRKDKSKFVLIKI